MKTIDVYEDNSRNILGEIKDLNEKPDFKGKICAIFLNYSKNSQVVKELENSGVCTFSFVGFVAKILSKTSKKFVYKNISDFIAVQIISSIAKPYLSEHFALKNLIKSESFSRELYNLFGLFKINKMTYDDLISASSAVNVSKDDEVRFGIIAKIYAKYLEKLSVHKLLDFRDAVLTTIIELKDNNLLKNFVKKTFSKIYVFGAENLSAIQLELLETVVGAENLTLIGDGNSKTHTFMGANVFKSSDTNLFHIPENTIYPLNKEIYSRAVFMKNQMKNAFDFAKTDAVEYRAFFDFSDELEHIAKTIINSVKKGDKYSDFAILIRDNSIVDKIIDVFKTFEIPVNGKLYSETFEFFKVKFERVLMMCEIFEKLKISAFGDFENVSSMSVVELENYAEQLNLLTENFLYETIKNKYDTERLLSVQNRKKYRFLLSAVLENMSVLNEEDAEKIKQEISSLMKSYSFFLDGDFVKIATLMTDMQDISDDNFHKFFAKFLSDLKDLSDLKSGILKEKLNVQSVLNLMQSDLRESIETDNKVSVLSIFKSTGQTFKTVFLPALTENYFPKKMKSTYFISDEANIKISTELNKKFKNFEKLIFSSEDELKDENSLLYTALTRAEEKIIISSYKYSDRKQISPSPYFEHFVGIDFENFVDVQKEKNVEQIQQIEVVENAADEEMTANSPVLLPDDKIRLSASSINRFLSCPRKFYYTKLLGLKTTSSFTASYGTSVHAIFELVMTKYLNQFSKDIFIHLGNILFDVKQSRETAIEAGFDKEKIVEEIEKLSDLDIEEMRTDFLSAMDNLELIGYFNEKPLSCNCEKFFDFSLQEIPNVTFNGFIDGIIRYENGWQLIDYKTSANKPSLSYLFSKNGVNFLSEKQGKYSNSKIELYDYQLPLYYLACLNSADLSEYKANLDEVGYLYVRPNNDKNGASWKDSVKVAQIKEFVAQIADNIKTTVVDKIYEKTKFESKYDTFKCKYCDFNEYCDKTGKEDEE